MNFTVVNRCFDVGNIVITGVSTSSVFLVGDTDCISLSSILIHRLNLSLSGRLSRWRRNHDSQNVQSEVLKVHSVGISSTLQIGDTEEQFLKSKVLAVQRYLSLFTEMKGHLNRMIFSFSGSRSRNFSQKPAYARLFP